MPVLVSCILKTKGNARADVGIDNTPFILLKNPP